MIETPTNTPGAWAGVPLDSQTEGSASTRQITGYLWPAGFLLSACMFALTYLRAWSDDPSGVHLMFWFSVLIMVVTVSMVVAAGPTRTSGFLAAVGIGVLLFLPKLFHSPTFFNFFDELAHWRALEHLDHGAGLFLQNPINKAVRFYPGLEAVSGVLVSTTGLSPFVVGNILILTVHALLPGALFLLYERATGSPRIALLAVVIYAANPAFVFFDSYFAYESLALPLAASALVAVAFSDQMDRRTARSLMGIAIALCLVVVLTHHITSWVLAALLLLLGLSTIWAWGWQDPFPRRLLAAGATTAAAIGAWLLLVAPYTFTYVAPTITESADAVGRFANGSTQHRQLFYRSTEPIYEKYGSYLAVVVLAFAFAYAVVKVASRARRVDRPDAARRDFVPPLAVIGATYFLSLPVAFLISNDAVTRVWEFAFIGVAPLVALALVGLLTSSRRLAHLLAVALLFIVLLGGVVSRTSLEQGLPGPYEPSADPRSMTQDVLAASTWMLDHYGPDNVVIGDRTAFAVFGSYGDQQAVSGQGVGARPWRVFFPRTITPEVLEELDRDKVRFVVVDERITKQLPRTGWYYSETEPGAMTRRHPLPAASLAKFASSPLFDSIYDNGNIVIYQYLHGQPSQA